MQGDNGVLSGMLTSLFMLKLCLINLFMENISHKTESGLIKITDLMLVVDWFDQPEAGGE